MQGFEQKPPAEWLYSLLRRRWVRWCLIVGVLSLVAGAVYSRTVVAPTLTATRIEVFVDGGERPSVLGVDSEAGLVTVEDGQNGLSEFALSGNSLFVLAREVGLSDAADSWVEVPLASVDAGYGALTPARVLAAMSRDVKECKRPSTDAVIIVELLFGVQDGGVSLCGRGSGHANSTQWIADNRSVRPSDLADFPTASAVPLEATADPATVLATLNRLITEPAP